MTRTAKRTGIFAAVFAVIIACALLIATQTSYADGYAGTMKYGKKITVSIQNSVVMVDFGKKAKGAKDITVTSSNKKVAKGLGFNKEEKQLALEIKKKGTAKLTFKIKTKSGTKTYKATLKAVAYKNPAKKITLGGKNITKKFKSHVYYDYKLKGKKAKISIKGNKGWKVKTIVHTYYTDDFTNYHVKKVKNGGTIKWAKNDSDTVIVTMYNKSKNQTESLLIIGY